MSTPVPAATARQMPEGLQFDDGYRIVFERNPTPMWVFDLDTHRFLAVNDAAVAEYGYPPEMFLTLTIRDVYEESDRPRLDSGLASAAQELFTGRWAHRRKDGSSLQVRAASGGGGAPGERTTARGDCGIE